MSPFDPAGTTQVRRLERDLQDEFARYEAYLRALNSSSELAADLSKFVCIRICGYLEQGIASMARAHCEARSDPLTARFAGSWLSKGQNPKRGTLIEFARRFDHSWGDEFIDVLDAIDPAGTLDSLVQTRNDIAHGLSTGIGHDTLVRYFGLVVDIVEWFETRLR